MTKRRIPASADKLDLATLSALVEQLSLARHDGHLTIMRFTTGWKAFLGTPDLSWDGREELWQLPDYPTLQEALAAMLVKGGAQ